MRNAEREFPVATMRTDCRDRGSFNNGAHSTDESRTHDDYQSSLSAYSSHLLFCSTTQHPLTTTLDWVTARVVTILSWEGQGMDDDC